MFAFFITMKLWDTLSEKNKERLAQCYEQLTGKKFIPPKRKPEMEDLSEMKKIMEEAPNYSVDVQGRER